MTRVAAIVGPTAVGKTALSLDVAAALGAGIVSLDSMQIYRGMDIGTATPSDDDLRRVPHHLVNERDPGDELTVAEFQSLARRAIEDIAARGGLPLLVGGSGLYFRAVVDDLRFPPRDPDVRAVLESEAEFAGPEALHDRLAYLDPEAAAKMEPANARRIVRALEVIELTGRRFSEFATAWETYDSPYDLRVAGLRRDRDVLYERIGVRVDAMLAAGLIAEVESLRREPLGRSASQALGYRQILDAPEDADPSDLRDEIVRATKRFARRQESWFSADPRVVWFDAAEDGVTGRITGFLAGGDARGEVP